MELYLPPILPKKQRTNGINWTMEMILKLQKKFPTTYNATLATELNISMRTLIRKARELGLEKEPNFFEIRRKEISVKAKKARRPNPTKGMKGWCVPNSEKTRFKKGQPSKMKTDPELVKRVHITRNETLRRDKIRRKLGLEPLTKFKRL